MVAISVRNSWTPCLDWTESDFTATVVSSFRTPCHLGEHLQFKEKFEEWTRKSKTEKHTEKNNAVSTIKLMSFLFNWNSELSIYTDMKSGICHTYSLFLCFIQSFVWHYSFGISVELLHPSSQIKFDPWQKAYPKLLSLINIKIFKMKTYQEQTKGSKLVLKVQSNDQLTCQMRAHCPQE